MHNHAHESLIHFIPSTLKNTHPLSLPNITTRTCHSSETLLALLNQHPNTPILYHLTSLEQDLTLIKKIRKTHFYPEFILLTNNHPFESLKKLSTLGIYAIHDHCVHPSILEIDIQNILRHKTSQKTALKKRTQQTLDKELYLHYKHTLQTPTPKHILLVEDDPKLSTKLAHYLKTKSFTCDTAPSIKKALTACTKKTYDIIILDIGLPDKTGDESIRALTHLTPQTAIIILTAYKEYELLTKCINLGAHDFITKPFNPTDLLDSIKHSHNIAFLKHHT